MAETRPCPVCDGGELWLATDHPAYPIHVGKCGACWGTGEVDSDDVALADHYAAIADAERDQDSTDSAKTRS